MYDGGMATLCLNETKAVMRGIVCKAYSLWAKSLLSITPIRNGGIKPMAREGVVYSLPATVWELEQQVAMETRIVQSVGLKEKISLHSFETDTDIYYDQNRTRAFMLNSELYPNFDFSYHNEAIHPNRHTKSNFFGWFDWCGLPTYDKLEVVLDRKNFVHNSVVFATFSCAWRRAENVPSEIMEMAFENFSDDDGDKLCNHVTDAVEAYLEKNTGHNVKVFASVEYQAQNTPMMMIGLTNCREILEWSQMRSPVRLRIDPAKRVAQTMRVTGKPAPRPLSESNQARLRKDLQDGHWTKRNLSLKYKCTERQISSTGAWLTKRGVAWGWEDEA